MKHQPVQVLFIFPPNRSPWSKKKYAHLKRFIEKMKEKANRSRLTIHISHAGSLEEPYAFDARVSFAPGAAGDQPAVSTELPVLEDIPAETEETVRHEAEQIAVQPLFLQLLPSRRIYTLMERLRKPVKVEVLTRVCTELFQIPDSTVRGTLNKHRDIYISPKHGLWMLKRYAESCGYTDYRR